MFDSIARETSLGRGRPVHQHRTYHGVIHGKLLKDAVSVGHQTAHRPLEAVVQVTEAVVGTLQDRDIGPEAL